MFSIIAAVGKNNELGKKNELIFQIKDDMKFFRETTVGHKVLMGKNTWKSLPKKLPGRRNLVVSWEEVEGADQVIDDLDAFIAENKDTDEEVFVIGGGQIYKTLLPHAQKLYLTEIDATDAEADTFFPEFDKKHYSRELIRKGNEDDLAYSIVKYSKTK